MLISKCEFNHKARNRRFKINLSYLIACISASLPGAYQLQFFLYKVEEGFLFVKFIPI